MRMYWEKDFTVLQLFSSRAPVLLGLDVSSTSVKLLELSLHQGQYRVESYAVVPIPPGVVFEKQIKDPAALSTVIKKAISKSKTTTRNAAIAVSDSSVITKVIQMDALMDEDEIEMQMTAVEAPKHIPYASEDVRLDFDVLGPAENNPNLVDVLLVASRAENVNVLSDCLVKADITPRVVDIESYAMERACKLLADELPNSGRDGAIAVVDIGSVMTTLTVLYDMSTIFSREEVFGGEQLTKAIQRHYGLSYSEAGLAKKAGGLPDDYVAEVLIPFKESAVLQVRRALQFFFSASQHTEICHIMLAGGTVNIPGLRGMIEEQIGIPCSIANPFHKMSIGKNVDLEGLTKDASALMICCGLALRGFESGKY